ncbi:hypothetical protein LUZ60_001790 [Juncus effusus]|nr:hypothetical protein LUZ60_001790 [Juncus effusus]
MSLACLVCHGMDNSFRSYSISSSEGEGRCGAVVTCFKPITNNNNNATSKVAPFPLVANPDGAPPRLQRSRAVSRDLVRDWNFDEVILDS